jgi:hypothetical protein
MIHKLSPAAIHTKMITILGSGDSEVQAPAGLVRTQIKKFAIAASQHLCWHGTGLVNSILDAV